MVKGSSTTLVKSALCEWHIKNLLYFQCDFLADANYTNTGYPGHYSGSVGINVIIFWGLNNDVSSLLMSWRCCVFHEKIENRCESICACLIGWLI